VDVVAARIIVRGRVQGVGYRWFARDAVEALAPADAAASGQAVAGWVRNLRDGSVELQVEGAPSLVQELLAKLKQGPPAAVVSALDVQWLPVPPEARAARFEIRPTA